MDRWDQIEHVYHAARDLAGVARVRFLDAHCGPDAAMRQQIEALLEQDESPDSFLNRPAVHLAAGWRSAAADQPSLVGRSLGPYRVVEQIGAGGMGEVYRARDPKLGRDVAIKILPAAFARDPGRLARFEREARALASLNHPSIAQIHGLEEAPGPLSGCSRAIVMELVEGEDLSARIARGPMPLDEVLAIARQIADALDAAHGAGIVHRDLKPANIKERADGRVKVLDFGLGKATTRAGASGEGGAAHAYFKTEAAIASPAMSVQGLILGTAPYMSPEQASGK